MTIRVCSRANQGDHHPAGHQLAVQAVMPAPILLHPFRLSAT